MKATEHAQSALVFRPHCKCVFVCRLRTRWRTARRRSRPSTLSYWRTCRTASVRWRNELHHLLHRNLSSFHLWPLHCRITFHLLVLPCAPFVSVWVIVCVHTVHVEGKEKDVLYSLLFVASCGRTLDPLHGRRSWDCECVWVCVCVDKLGSLPPRFFLSLFTWFLCVSVFGWCIVIHSPICTEEYWI